MEWRICRRSAFSGARVLSRFCRMRWMSSALASKVADLVRVRVRVRVGVAVEVRVRVRVRVRVGVGVAVGVGVRVRAASRS